MTVLNEGRTIAGLRIGRLLGHGAMGEVYRAEQLVLARPVAVKRILPQFAGSTGAVERLAREARALASVRSPYVVQVHDLVQADGEILLVMELIEGGGALRPWCGRLAWPDVCCLIRHLAEALAAAHAVGIIHRDVKPDNALLAADGTARLGDFGLARALDATQLTAAGSVLGTPAYLAPECRDGTPGGQAADVYALGCTWFHLLTGQPPYRGSDITDLLRRHAEEAPPDPAHSVVGLDPAIARLLSSCLAKQPGERPSASDLARELAAHSGIPERLSTVEPAIATQLALTPATAPTAVPATAPTAAVTPLQPRPRSRRLLWSCVVLAVVIIGLAVWLPGMRAARAAEQRNVVLKLAEIGQIAEARSRIVALVERNPGAQVGDLVREVDLAEARQLWRTGRRDQATTAYADLLNNHRGDRLAARAVIDDLPAHEPVVLDAVLALPALETPKDVAVAWRWIVPANGVAEYGKRLIALLATVDGAEADARRRLGDEEPAVRDAALGILDALKRTSDADRIRFHCENMIRLHSAYGVARESLAWLISEAAKPDWEHRRQSTSLPSFADVIPLRNDDEHGDAVERLLIQSFPGQIKGLLSAWKQDESEALRTRATRMAAALTP